jgi:uncharacterized C2H2 Zn-finger protein
MIFYKCEKCNKEFNQKSNYLSHINRKKSCIDIVNNTNINNNIINYKCEKCNKEFNYKTNYLSHINRKKSCIIDDNTNKTHNVIYKCEICNKEFNKKSNYLSHINKKNPCNSKDLINKNKILLDKIKELENIKIYNTKLEHENIKLKSENDKINELLNKFINNNSSNIINNNNNNNNTSNIISSNNTINITLTNFGNEKWNKLTENEPLALCERYASKQLQILKFSNLSLSNLIKYLHINDNYPQYKNICIKNLRGKGGYLYEDNMWNFCNFEKLLLCLFKNKICDLEKILNNNSDKN